MAQFHPILLLYSNFFSCKEYTFLLNNFPSVIGLIPKEMLELPLGSSLAWADFLQAPLTATCQMAFLLSVSIGGSGPRPAPAL